MSGWDLREGRRLPAAAQVTFPSSQFCTGALYCAMHLRFKLVVGRVILSLLCPMCAASYVFSVHFALALALALAQGLAQCGGWQVLGRATSLPHDAPLLLLHRANSPFQPKITPLSSKDQDFKRNICSLLLIQLEPLCKQLNMIGDDGGDNESENYN